MQLIALVALFACTPPEPACRDVDALIFFADRDEDGYGDPEAPLLACTQPSGHADNGMDCDDLRPEVHPGAFELCDGRDNDCDFSVDEDLPWRWFLADRDQDGFGDISTKVQACAPTESLTRTPGDCNDFDAGINPDQKERCNGKDDDCNGLTDDADPGLDTTGLQTYWPDEDLDGYGDQDQPILACLQPPGTVDNGDDCDDRFEFVNPKGFEVCGGIDDDCDGLTDDSDPSLITLTRTIWYRDADNDGYGHPSYPLPLCSQPWFYADNDDDCDDNDPGLGPPTDWLPDQDGDLAGDSLGGRFGPACSGPPGTVPATYPQDCDDGNPRIYVGATEICADGIDQDCDGEDNPWAWYPDADGDGYGVTAGLLVQCNGPAPSGHAPLSGDCDETRSQVHPGQPELCNGIDDDCDGLLEAGASDLDGDGWRVCEGDPDDEDANTLPYTTHRIAGPDQLWLGTDRLRGNQFEVDAQGTLFSFGLLLDLSSTCTLDYYVHTAPTTQGPWALLASARATHPAGPLAYRHSPTLNFAVNPGDLLALSVGIRGCTAVWASKQGGLDLKDTGIGRFKQAIWTDGYPGYSTTYISPLLAWAVPDYAFAMEVRMLNTASIIETGGPTDTARADTGHADTSHADTSHADTGRAETGQ